MNNKGFTLVEVLAVIAIIGILSGVAVMGVTKYLQESKNQAYDILAHSSAVATENYILDSGATDSKVAIKDLVDKGYLENRIDPANKNKKCSGSVFIDRNETDETLSSNSYSVLLHCSGKIRSYKFSNANDGELNEEIYTEIELPCDTNISDDIDYDNNYNYTLYKIPRKQKLSLQNTETPYCYSDNYKFDENTPTFLYDNRYVLRELLLNGVKFKTDVPLNVLPIEEVFELFKKNYTIDDIDKINIFKNNPLIIEWGLQNGISMEKIYDNLDISAFSNIDNKTIIIKKPSIENINQVITLLKSNPKVDVDKINIDISLDMDGEILDYTNLVYLENLKKNNLNINFSVDSDEISLDTMILNEQFLEKTAEEIKNSPLSPFEKYIAAYDIVKTLKRYKGKDEGHRSRQLYAIMGGDLMVCVGYANLLENLLSRIGIPCSKLHCVAIKDADKGYTEGHARNYVYIKDPSTGELDKKTISIGLRDDNFTEVKEGLEEGQEVFYESLTPVPAKYETATVERGLYTLQFTSKGIESTEKSSTCKASKVLKYLFLHSPSII